MKQKWNFNEMWFIDSQTFINIDAIESKVPRTKQLYEDESVVLHGFQQFSVATW